jgi:hypothetical protein
MFDIPDPVSMYESAKTAGLERDIADALVSSTLSAAITAMWVSGVAKWAIWTGEGQALKDAATVQYLTLKNSPKTNFLTLTVPKDLLDADNLSRFQTEEKTK